MPPTSPRLARCPVTGRADLSSRTAATASSSPTSASAPRTTATSSCCVRAAWSPSPRARPASFDLIFRPQAADADPGERSITPDETEIGYYEESGLSLEDVVREQVLLSLPSRTLCKEDCKGLCPRCGQNLNLGTCNCDPPPDRQPDGMRLRVWPARSNPDNASFEYHRSPAPQASAQP